MSADLSKYRTKRDFGRTPEPRGDAERSVAERPQFVVQKHDARRLHYDFRLEHDGVLKSWAVPKGPSLAPEERRLAVQTEDHPLEYATFEGVIPERQYGAGAVLVWDRGHWAPESDPGKGLEKGKLDFTLHGEKLRGRWTLVRLAPRGKDKDNWLLIKRRDREARSNGAAAELVDLRPESVLTGRDIEAVAAARDRIWHSDGDGEATGRTNAEVGRPDTVPGARRGGLPRKLAVQRPSPADDVPEGAGWFHEPQLDGARIVVSVTNERVTLRRAEAGDTLSSPTLLDAIRSLPCESALLDAIAVVLDERGVSDRSRLDSALEAGRLPEHAVLVVVDLLHLDGWDLRHAALRARKELLRLWSSGAPPALRYGDHVEGHGADFYREACRLGLRGVVSKQADAPYRGGQGPAWVVTRCRPKAAGRRTGGRGAKSS